MFKFTFLVISLLFPLVSADAWTNQKECKIIYDSQSDNTALRFDLRNDYLSTHDKRSPEIFKEQTEFGGYFTNCTNNKFYCISGPIDLLLPRRVQLLHWSNKTTLCNAKRIHLLYTTLYAVVCSSSYGNRIRITRFDYSPSRGVTSFRILSPSNGVMYSLLGERGLFATPKCHHTDSSIQ